MEGVTLGMNYGLRRLAELGVKPKQIRATGGGAKSQALAADHGRRVQRRSRDAQGGRRRGLRRGVAGALVLALQDRARRCDISDITDEFVTLNKAETAEPNAESRGHLSRVAGVAG